MSIQAHYRQSPVPQRRSTDHKESQLFRIALPTLRHLSITLYPVPRHHKCMVLLTVGCREFAWLVPSSYKPLEA